MILLLLICSNCNIDYLFVAISSMGTEQTDNVSSKWKRSNKRKNKERDFLDAPTSYY